MPETPIKVMVLDDEEGIVHYVHKILQLKGYQTLTAMEGTQAVALFERERPQISILDVHLSNSAIDGVEVLQKIKEIDPRAECIMLSRITDESKVTKAKELGALHYLLKPIDTKDLIAVVNEVAAAIRKRWADG